MIGSAMRPFAQGNSASSGFGGGRAGGFNAQDINDIFGDFFGDFMGGSTRRTRTSTNIKGSDLKYEPLLALKRHLEELIKTLILEQK